METLKINKTLSENDFILCRQETGLSVNYNITESTSAFLFAISGEATLENTIRVINWLISHGYISIEN